MVYISHRMNEILEICDRVTVIRDGKKVITEKVENLTMEEIVAQMMGNEAKETKGMPTAIVMNTVKGKGVSFMENKVNWHGAAPNDEQYKVAMEDLEKVGEALCQK